MTDAESSTLQKRPPLKNAAAFLFLAVNGTWVFAAYLLRRAGLPLGLIATVLVLGAVFGNLAIYAGIRLAGWMLRKNGRS